MLKTVFFLSDNGTYFLDKEGCNTVSNFHLSFLIDCYKEQALKDAYIFFSKNNTSNFSLTLKIMEPLPVFCIPLIIPFFFIPSYENYQKNLNIICDDLLLFNEISTTLKNEFLKQGIQNVSINLLTQPSFLPEITNAGQPLTYLLFKEEKFFLESYRSSLNTLDFKDNIYCFQPGVQTPRVIIDALQQVDINLKNEHPILYYTIKRKNFLSEENFLLKRKIELLKNELENYKDHNEILRQAHSSNKLQQYYDAEYEILPRWFKQCGHLLKVLMGTRSLRSLFNKNIKNLSA